MANYGGTDEQKRSAGAGEKTDLNQSKASGFLTGLFDSQPAPQNLTVPQKDLLILFRQLAVILQSGVSLAQGLVLIAENMSNKKLAHCVQRISARLSAGEELSLSLRQYPKVFKPITIGLIEAGEAGGILDQVLERIALLMEEQAKVRGQIIGALVYPVLVFVLALSVSMALLILVVPRFKDMFDGMGADLPALTAFMLRLSELVTTWQFAVGGPIGIILFVYIFKVIYSSKSGRLRIDTAIFSVPLFGDLILRSEMAGMCDTLATLVNSGIPVVDGLERCVSASSNERIRTTIRRGINLVIQGQELNYSLSQSQVFPNLVISMIKIGEETGKLSFMLEKLAIFYKREVESTVSSLTKAMEPAVIFVVALIVGTIVIALYLPMFSMIQNYGQ